MANTFTDEAETRMIDWITGVGSPVRPTLPLKVALFTTVPNQETGLGGTEVAGNGYARTSVTFSAAADGATSNSADITFATASGGNWGTITGIGILDSAATPVLLCVATLGTNKVINDGETFRIVSGALTLALD